MVLLWFDRVKTKDRKRLFEALEHLGKWSMMDVFVVALVVVIAKISALADAHARYGIYFFGASILLSMAVGLRIKGHTKI